MRIACQAFSAEEQVAELVARAFFEAKAKGRNFSNIGGGGGRAETTRDDARNVSSVTRRLFSENDDGGTTTCFSLVMVDDYGDGWNGAEFQVRDTQANTLAASGTLSNGASETDEVCLSTAGCYTFRVTSGSYPSEVSWTFGGTLSGGAPYGPVVIWVRDGGALETGPSCPTPTPTLSLVPTPAPTATPVPSTTPAPSPNPTTPRPTPAPTPNPTPQFVDLQAENWLQLRAAAQVPYANINITAEQILMPTQIELSHSIYIFSTCNTSLRRAPSDK